MKAVYYCRVSTEEESQVNALTSQIEEAKNCIIQNGWTEVDSYVDEGKSGTQTIKRNEYNRLYNDLNTNKFQVIVIKSQDRLMRNVKDWYLFIDKLVTNNKQLFFYLENKFYTPDDALVSGIKAILAEEYSRDLSKKLNNAHKGRQAKGTSIVLTSATWGYDKINKNVVINEKEAEIVRLIYDLYIQGYGSRTISKELSNRGIKSRTGNDFAEVTIRHIIRNPLFKGTVVMNKRHKNFNTKKVEHVPKEDWMIYEDAVPAIVSKETWNKANVIMDTKSKVVHADKFSERKLGTNLGKYDLSSKIFCGECGSKYWRRYRKNTKGAQIVDWSCCEYIKRGRKNIKDTRGKSNLKLETEGGCDNIHIKEDDLNNILLEVAKEIFDNKRIAIYEKAFSYMKVRLSKSKVEEERKKIDTEKSKIIKQKNLLLDKLLEDIISNEDYKRRDSELEIKLASIIENENKLIEQETNVVSVQERLDDIKKYLYDGKGGDEKDLKKLIEHIIKIVVFNDHLEIYLDIYDPIRVDVLNENKHHRKYQYVESTKHLIPHTDKYRYEGKFREVIVKLYI